MVDLEIIRHKMCLIRCHETIANIIGGSLGALVLGRSQNTKYYQNVIKKSKVTFGSGHYEEKFGQILYFMS